MERRLTRDMFPGGTDERLMIRGDICDQGIIQDILGIYDDLNTEENILQNKDAYSSHYIGNKRLYQTFSRKSGADPYHYAGLCAHGEDKNLHPSTGKKTYIISQYHGETEEEMDFNARFAQALAREIMLKHGDIPVAPHIYFTSFCADVGWERDFGIEAGHLMMNSCDSVIIAPIDGRISKGMASDIEYATINLGLTPMVREFTSEQAKIFVTEMERDKYEEWNRAEHR